jgi:hypothetical protein
LHALGHGLGRRMSIRAVGVVVALFFSGVWSTSGVAVSASELPPLSSLVSGCAIESAPLGSQVPVGWADGLWLTCQGVRLLVVHPDNLLSKVKIKDGQQALEFVRFFSSVETFVSVHLGGCVEIVDTSSDDLFYRIEPTLFKRYFKRHAAEAQGGGKNDSLSFVVSRAVVCSDQAVYQLTEQVFPDGMYFQIDKKRILKRAGTVGVVHVAPH